MGSNGSVIPPPLEGEVDREAGRRGFAEAPLHPLTGLRPELPLMGSNSPLQFLPLLRQGYRIWPSMESRKASSHPARLSFFFIEPFAG